MIYIKLVIRFFILLYRDHIQELRYIFLVGTFYKIITKRVVKYN